MRQVLAWLTAVAPLLATVVDGTAVPQAEREAEKEALAPEICCAALRRVLGASVVYPSDERYTSSLASYWVAQVSVVTSNCIVVASSSQDVSRVVKVLTRTGKCRFAIRSGAHSPWPDAANIENGVTIDLSSMNSVSLSEDRTVASVGPGAKWVDVYKTLEAFGRAVVGGRAAPVGVGGLTTGGGNSFLTGRYGFVADNVKNFEIVLASGEIVNANQHERSDLFQALKGGSNNFGVVTRFDLMAYEQGPLWGGLVVYPESTLPQQIPAYVRFVDAIASDPDASLVALNIFDSSSNSSIQANAYVYLKPEPYPAIFRELTSIQPELVNTQRVSPLSDQVNLEGLIPGKRNFQSTITVANDADVIAKCIQISRTMRQPVSGSRNMTWQTLLQPIPRHFTELSIAKGGNIFGLDRVQENSVLFLLAVIWSDEADDAAINAAAQGTIQAMSDYAHSVGALRDYIFLNYAGREQQVIASYGPDNVRKMRDVSKRYDPDRVFQELVPGGYKIPRG